MPSAAAPATDVLAFARAVSAGDNVRLHTGNNEYAASGDWPTEAPSEPWAVYVARFGRFRTLAADFDAKDGDAQADAMDLVSRMHDVGMNGVLVASGGGGFHVFATFAPPLPTEVMSGLAFEMRSAYSTLDPNCLRDHSAIRPPLAPHRKGGRSEVIGDEMTALTVLREGNATRIAYALATTLRSARCARAGHSLDQAKQKLTATGVTLLEGGRPRGVDPSASAVEWSFILSAMQCGLDVDEAIALLLDQQHRAGDRLRREAQKHGEKKALAAFHRQWTRAAEYIKVNPAISSSTDARRVLNALSDAVTAHPWRGLAGASDSAVMEGLITIGLKASAVTFTASHRQIALVSKVHRKTVAKSMIRLADAGLLRVLKSGVGLKASTIRLLTSGIPCFDPLVTSHGGWETVGPTDGMTRREGLHDAFRYRGLGQPARLIFSALDLVDARSAAEVVARSGFSRSTVYKHLEALRAVELVEEVGRGRWVRTDTSLDLVAYEIGTFGSTDNQRAHYALERDLYQRALGLVGDADGGES